MVPETKPYKHSIWILLTLRFIKQKHCSGLQQLRQPSLRGGSRWRATAAMEDGTFSRMSPLSRGEEGRKTLRCGASKGPVFLTLVLRDFCWRVVLLHVQMNHPMVAQGDVVRVILLG